MLEDLQSRVEVVGHRLFKKHMLPVFKTPDGKSFMKIMGSTYQNRIKLNLIQGIYESGENVGIDLMLLLKMLCVDLTDINQCTD